MKMVLVLAAEMAKKRAKKHIYGSRAIMVENKEVILNKNS